VATTALGATTTDHVSGRRPAARRTGRARVALVGGGLVAAMLVGGAGLGYAMEEPPVPTGAASEATTDLAGPPAPTGAASTPTPTPDPTPAPTSVSPPAPTATTTAPTGSPTPTGDPAPSTADPSPSTSTSAPPPDVTAPTVGRVAASPTTLDPTGCPYGPTASTVTALVQDDRTDADDLRVRARYTIENQSYERRMDPAGGNRFQGVLANLPRPASTVRIPVTVVATDAAGNTTSGDTTYVTLYSFCTPG
jgi:serine/threonine-protein kinase